MTNNTDRARNEKPSVNELNWFPSNSNIETLTYDVTIFRGKVFKDKKG